MKDILLRGLVLALLAIFGAFSFAFWGAVIGPLAGLAAIVLVPRALRSNPAFAPP